MTKAGRRGRRVVGVGWCESGGSVGTSVGTWHGDGIPKCIRRVDAWRRIIYDNDADETARYCQWDESDMADPEAAKDLFTQIGLVQLMHVYIAKVLASRKGETSYHGA